MPYSSSDDAFLAELRRVVAPGGLLWFATHGVGFYVDRLRNVPGARGRARNAANIVSGAISMWTGKKLRRDTPVTEKWLRAALPRAGFDVRAIESSPRPPRLIRATCSVR
jgi:hypothetical protein